MRQPPKLIERKRRTCTTYYVEVKGTQHNLGTDKAEAKRKYGALLAADEPTEVAAGPLLVVELIDQFLAHLKKTAKAEATFKWYDKHLTHKRSGFKSWLLGRHNRLAVTALKPAHVEDWILERYKKGGNHKIGGVRSANRVCNWAVARGLISVNPVAKAVRPTYRPRKNAYLKPEQWAKIIAAIEPGPFHDLVMFLKMTGARPHEACIAEVRHFEPENTCLAFEQDESKGDRDQRVIQLGTGEALEIVKRLATKAERHLFTKENGKPWTNAALNRRCDEVEKATGVHFFCYQLRHSFVTDYLKAGVDPIKVAQLCGHRDLAMILKTYNHTNAKSPHLRDVLDKMNAA
jgi:integrase